MEINNNIPYLEQLYLGFDAVVAALVKYDGIEVENPDEVLKEMDRYLQSVLLRCALADNNFDAAEGILISKIGKYDSIIDKNTMLNFTNNSDVDGINRQTLLLPLLNDIINRNMPDVPEFWKIAVLVNNSNPDFSDTCQMLLSTIQSMELQIIGADNNLDIEEGRVADNVVTPLVTYANDMGIYFNGFDPRKLDEIAGEKEAMFLRAGKYKRNGQLKEAFNLYNQLAEEGHAGAQLMLAEMYDLGEGVKQDDYLTFKWTLKSAENGNDEAMNNVAVCYKNGQGTEQSLEKALYWYHESAIRGNADGMGNYGRNLYLLYTLTHDVKSLKEAQIWCQKAINAGAYHIAPVLARINSEIQFL